MQNFPTQGGSAPCSPHQVGAAPWTPAREPASWIPVFVTNFTAPRGEVILDPPVLVTIFWQFSMHTGIEPNFIWKNCIWLNTFSLDFKIRASQQRHHYFEPTCMPLNHFQLDLKVVHLHSTHIWILIFWDNLSNDQAIPGSWETNLPRLSKCRTHVFCFLPGLSTMTPFWEWFKV